MLAQSLHGPEVALAEGSKELSFVVNFVGELGNELAETMGAVGVAATGYREFEELGGGGGETVFFVRGAAVGNFHGVNQLEDRVLRGFFGPGGYGFIGVGVKVRTGTVMLTEDAAERVGGYDEAADGMSGFAEFCGAVEAALVAVDTEAENVSHVGVGFHSTDEYDIVLGGEGGKLVPVPGTGVLGYAEAAQAEAFRFQDEVFGGQAGVGAAFGSMDMEVKEASHKQYQCMPAGGRRQRRRWGLQVAGAWSGSFWSIGR